MNEVRQSRITVIIPVYNGQRFLKAAIDSVLAQTLGDWELIVVDDGSTDATPRILAEYQDPRIVKIRKDNGGESSARNAGLNRATGEYVAFLDADDLYLPNALADLSRFLEQHPEYDVVYSNGYISDEDGRTLAQLSDVRPGLYTGNVLEHLLTINLVITQGCTCTRRSVIDRQKIRFDENMVIGPDGDFWIQVARFAPFGYLDALTCVYRVHQTSIQRTSGQARRNRDLVYARMKRLNSDWFQHVSIPTRRRFFYRLLIELLADQPAQQKAILEGGQLRRLPPHCQAELWRRVGVDHLLRRSEGAFGLDCLRQAVRACPDDRRSRALLWISRLDDSVLYRVLRLWRALHRLVGRARALGKRRPAPMPGALRRATD